MQYFTIIHIFFGDMRLEKYTLEHRNLGQAEGAHKVGASVRCSQKTGKIRRIFHESEAIFGVPENACIFGVNLLFQDIRRFWYQS